MATAGTDVTVGLVPPEATYDLRRRVLRPGRPPEAARLAVDGLPDTAAFAARDRDGIVVGTAIAYPEPCPFLPAAPAWRLRGMATDPSRRGRGVGGRVLAAVVAHVEGTAGRLLWCNARAPARRFYERAGFVAHGEPWDDPEIGPHVAMALPLPRARPRAERR